jgi:thiamine pyrophosphokinase
MRIVIITGGSIDDAFASGFLEKWKPDKVIAADKGLEFCAAKGIQPEYIVGDFDSTDPEILSSFQQVRTDVYPAEKDDGDTQLALNQAIEMGATEVLFLGATGSRLDHTMVNILNLARLHEKGILGWVVDAHNRIHIAPTNHFTIRKEEQFGKYISFLPYGGSVEGLCLRGFHYPLENFHMGPGNEGRFVSNQIDAEAGEVSFRSGTLIVMETRD